MAAFSLRGKRAISTFVLAMLFFGQFVLAVQGCLAADDLAPFARHSDMQSMTMSDMKSMPDCEKIKTSNPNGCLTALTQSDQAVAHHNELDTGAVPTVAVTLIPVDTGARPSRHSLQPRTDLKRYANLPTSILFCSFQI